MLHTQLKFCMHIDQIGPLIMYFFKCMHFYRLRFCDAGMLYCLVEYLIGYSTVAGPGAVHDGMLYSSRSQGQELLYSSRARSST